LIRVADAGAGTGRFAMPVAEAAKRLGVEYEVVAIDLSCRMLSRLRERWLARFDAAGLVLVRADLQEPLPTECRNVHVAYTVATFHILDHWREALDNVVKNLVPGGFVILIRENNQFMHETEGFEKDRDFPRIDAQLRCFMQFYHQQRAAAGEPYEPPELRYSDMLPAVRYMAELGLVEQPVAFPPSAFEWEKPHTYADILHCFRNRQMTTWGSDLSDGAREKISQALGKWVEAQDIDLDTEFYLPAKLIPHIFHKLS